VASGRSVDHAERWRRGISPNDMGLSRSHILAAVEASLRRLRTDYLDLYQIHRWDPVTPLDETMSVLDELVDTGKVRYVGCSGFTPYQLAHAHAASEARKFVRFVSQQVPFNLLAREAQSATVAACQHLGVGVLAFMPLAGGLLTGRYDREAGPSPGSRFAARPTYREAFWTSAAFALVDELTHVAPNTGRTPTELALGWVVAHPAVNAVLVGAERVDELTENVKVFERPLDADELAAVDAGAERARRG
jgi:aryl-alcohol dehydrogenase-like predicted oxidoreductase